MSNKVFQVQAGNPDIIAPCGINCGLCRAYIRDRKPCPGCRGGENYKSNACLTCVIKNCPELAVDGHKFCFSCSKYPCADLLHLDHRYRIRYGVSVVENLERIRTIGVRRFAAEEAVRWACSKCGDRLCMHKPQCINCGYRWQVNSKG